MERFRIGVDLGGTKIECVALSASGEIAARRRCDTPADYDDALRAIAELVAEVETFSMVASATIVCAPTPASG